MMLVEAFQWRSVYKNTMSITKELFKGSCHQLRQKNTLPKTSCLTITIFIYKTLLLYFIILSILHGARRLECHVVMHDL